jgi:hypothetical protein
MGLNYDKVFAQIEKILILTLLDMMQTVPGSG